MFAKLKKKVIEENGGRGMEVGDKSLTASPAAVLSRRESGTPAAIHSPLSKEPPVGGLKAAYSMERLAASPPVPAPEESGGRESAMSREDLLALLAKRTEQCKKMEGNISDLAALIKDKNKTLEQLETQNQQHEEVLNKRLAEQKAEFEAYRDKLIAGYQEDKLAMDKEKQEVTQKLLLAEEYRDKFLKREADTDEIQDFTVQELAKVKHMLLLAQTELESQRKELESKSQLLTTCQSREKQLEVDLTQTTGRLDVLEKECERLRDDNKERAELVTSLSKEKSVFEQRLNQLNTELTEKQNKIVEINRQLSDVDSSYRALEHSSEMHRNKAAQQTAKLLEEKQEHIDMHQERVATLEQRLHDQSLSGDDRVTALQAEREGLEKKLSETRQQLTEIKSTWSDKISHLEAQISHLNTKIVEDSEELASSQRAADSMRENFHKQMEDLRAQLEDAEKRALENYEMASSAQSKHEQQVRDLEGEVSRSRLSAVDMETQLRGKVTSLELQLSELTTAREAQADEFRMQMEQKERQTQEAIERELKQEHLLKTTEARCSQLQNEVTSQQEELGRLKRQLDVQNHTSSGQDLKVQKLEQQVEELKTELTATRSDLSATRRQFNESDQEKGELMVRNAQLSQQLTSHQQQLSQQRGDLESQLAEREQTIQGQEEIIANLNERMAALQSQIQELESLNAALGSTDHLESTIQSLQDQLADKTRTLKKQEQTVKDLRQTLQRELRVQALPNDEASDDNNAPSPSVPRKHLPPPRQAVPPTSASPQSASLTMTSSAVLPVSSSSSVSSSTTAAVKPMTLTSMMQVSQERGIVVRRDLEQDINFQYLKHVVLKFMLSRESEAVQLIKAVAVLLNFSHQEQQLIRQTLEWKMSWFGSKPSMGKGQKSKIVPPPF